MIINVKTKKRLICGFAENLSNEEMIEVSDTWKKINHYPMMRIAVPGKTCTFGEGFPRAKIVGLSKADPKKVVIELEADMVDPFTHKVSFQKGHQAEMEMSKLRYLD